MVSAIVGFINITQISLLANVLQLSFPLSYTGTKILLYTFRSKTVRIFLSLFVSIQVSDAYITDLSIIVFFNIDFSFLVIFLFLKKFL